MHSFRTHISAWPKLVYPADSQCTWPHADPNRTWTQLMVPNSQEKCWFNNTKIIYTNNDPFRLQIIEAFLIKQNRPSINSQVTGSHRTLKLQWPPPHQYFSPLLYLTPRNIEPYIHNTPLTAAVLKSIVFLHQLYHGSINIPCDHPLRFCTVTVLQKVKKNYTYLTSLSAIFSIHFTFDSLWIRMSIC